MSREVIIPICSALVRLYCSAEPSSRPPVQERPGHTGGSPTWGHQNIGALLLRAETEGDGTVQPGEEEAQRDLIKVSK